MSSYYFVIPDAVWFCCILPAIIIILASILFGIVYRYKKDTKYYTYTLNYVYSITSILICLLLFPLLLGYSAAILYTIAKGIVLVESVNIILKVLLIILPLIPLVTLIYVVSRFIKNLELKTEIDDNSVEA